MDIGLDIRMLTKCFGGNTIATLENDSHSYEAILSLVNEDIVSQINIEEVLLGMHSLADTPNTLMNLNIFLKATTLDKAMKFRRIISYVKNKITVLDFLGGLLASGHQAIADLLLRRVYQKTVGERTLAVPKVQTGDRSIVYVLVKKLKQIIDSKTIRHPSKAIRRIAIEYKSQLHRESDITRKQRLADKYLGVLAVEIDSDYFSPNSYVSIQSLMSEFMRVTQMSSYPSLYEGCLHIRHASYYSVCGQIDVAKDMITHAMVVIGDTASCPELTNIWYETLNVYLHEFEKVPVRENRDKVIQTGYTGIQTTTQSQFDMQQFWLSHFLIRMAFACLGIGIRGNVIPGVIVTAKDIDLAEILLAGVIEKELTMRRKMFYSVAKGRYYQLKNDWPKAAYHIQDATTLSLKLGFEESKYILGSYTEQTQSKMPR